MYNITLVSKLRKKKGAETTSSGKFSKRNSTYVQGAHTSKGCAYIYEFWYNMSQVA